MLGLVVIMVLLLLAVFADVVAPHSPIEQFRDHFLTPPVWQQGGDRAFPLGTDDVGRDVLVAADLRRAAVAADRRRRW